MERALPTPSIHRCYQRRTNRRDKNHGNKEQIAQDCSYFLAILEEEAGGFRRGGGRNPRWRVRKGDGFADVGSEIADAVWACAGGHG